MEIYAWIGQDEFGSDRVGIKQGIVPAGLIPLVAMDFDVHKLQRPDLLDQLQLQATAFGKTIRLAKFTFVEDALVINPKV